MTSVNISDHLGSPGVARPLIPNHTPPDAADPPRTTDHLWDLEGGGGRGDPGVECDFFKIQSKPVVPRGGREGEEPKGLEPNHFSVFPMAPACRPAQTRRPHET